MSDLRGADTTLDCCNCGCTFPAHTWWGVRLCAWQLCEPCRGLGLRIGYKTPGDLSDNRRVLRDRKGCLVKELDDGSNS